MNEKIRGVGFDKSIDLYQVAYPGKKLIHLAVHTRVYYLHFIIS